MKELRTIYQKYSNYLEELLIKEYGYKYEKLIKNRLARTSYIFKSHPSITYFSLKESGYDVKNYKSLNKYYQEYLNYQQVEYYLNRKINVRIYEFLKTKLKVTDEYIRKHIEEILNLDYKVFSKEYMNILYNSNDKILKSIIINMQNDFINTYIDLGLSLDDINTIIELNNYISKLEIKKELELLKRTTFGNKMTKYISSILDNIPSSNALFYARDMIFSNFSALTYSIKRKMKSYAIVYIPILKLKNDLSIDHTLIHESIHALESNNGKSGIDNIKQNNYFLNELKTESKAIGIHNNLKKDGVLIFDTKKNKDKTEVLYTPFLPLIEYLSKDYKELFDYCSLHNKVLPLYKAFGEENFINYSKSVNELYHDIIVLNEILQENATITINPESFKKQADMMKQYAKYKKIK